MCCNVGHNYCEHSVIGNPDFADDPVRASILDIGSLPHARNISWHRSGGRFTQPRPCPYDPSFHRVHRRPAPHFNSADLTSLLALNKVGIASVFPAATDGLHHLNGIPSHWFNEPDRLEVFHRAAGLNLAGRSNYSRQSDPTTAQWRVPLQWAAASSDSSKYFAPGYLSINSFARCRRGSRSGRNHTGIGMVGVESGSSTHLEDDGTYDSMEMGCWGHRTSHHLILSLPSESSVRYLVESWRRREMRDAPVRESRLGCALAPPLPPVGARERSPKPCLPLRWWQEPSRVDHMFQIRAPLRAGHDFLPPRPLRIDPSTFLSRCQPLGVNTSVMPLRRLSLPSSSPRPQHGYQACTRQYELLNILRIGCGSVNLAIARSMVCDLSLLRAPGDHHSSVDRQVKSGSATGVLTRGTIGYGGLARILAGLPALCGACRARPIRGMNCTMRTSKREDAGISSPKIYRVVQPAAASAESVFPRELPLLPVHMSDPTHNSRLSRFCGYREAGCGGGRRSLGAKARDNGWPDAVPRPRLKARDSCWIRKWSAIVFKPHQLRRRSNGSPRRMRMSYIGMIHLSEAQFHNSPFVPASHSAIPRFAQRGAGRHAT
ncbi:hypothetical protein DFH09DRAFT_1091534 [Mycena vulgaris]|nr:hypothetical protein DFH09DRAFT_1091534 [Mycena vulgaris]